MREIELRAWDGKVMLYGVEKLHYPIAYYKTTLMEYTGLKDKNKSKIWEGDILAYENGLGVVGEPKGYVCFLAGAFRLKRFKEPRTVWLNEMYLFKYTKRHVVIGNLYQNPELIVK